MLSCTIWKNVQRVHDTKSITGLNNYCMLHMPMLLVLKTLNPLSQNQTVIFQRSNMVRKYCIAHLGIILVNIQGGCFSSIHQKMRLITYFEKAFKNPCFKVIQSPFYWSTHSCTRILFVCLWQSAKDPWMATYFHYKDLISVLWILTKLYTVGLQPLTGRVRTEYFRIELLKCAKIAFFHIGLGIFTMTCCCVRT